MRLLDKIIIIQGVKKTIQPLEVGYANSPKKAQKGAYVASSLTYGPAWLQSNNLCKVIYVPLNTPNVKKGKSSLTRGQRGGGGGLGVPRVGTRDMG